MLKKLASRRRPLFGLSGLSGFLVERNQSDNQINQIDQITRQTGLLSDRRTIEVFVCHNSFSAVS